MDDAALIALIAAGNADATTEFYNRWFPQFARLATRLTGNDTVGEDLAQEAIVRVIMNAGNYQQGRAPRSWLIAIVYNLARDWIRRTKVRRAQSFSGQHNDDDDCPQAIEIADREATAEERAIAREREDAVREALAKLSEDDREVIILRDYERLSGTETARLLEISVDKVGSRLFRARRRLGALLQTDWPGLFPSHEL